MADNQHKGSDNYNDDWDLNALWIILRIILFVVSLPMTLGIAIVASTLPSRDRSLFKFTMELFNFFDTFDIFSGK